MQEKKFLESIEDGELDIAVYARSWEEGDNVTVTCDLLFAMEQAVGVFNEQKAKIERLTEEKQSLIGRKAGLDYSHNQVKEKNAELQKQVDELTNENKELWNSYHKGYQVGYEYGKQDALTSDRKEDCTVQSETSAYDKAVKDTAKGIYKEIGKDDILVVQTQEYGEIEVVPIERLKEIIKKKGVEVE